MKHLWLLLLLIPLVHAQTLVDANSGKAIGSGFLRVQSANGIQDYYFNGSIPLNITNATLLLRQGSSDTFEYVAQVSEPQPTIVMYPAGLLEGQVQDTKDNFIIHADVHIACRTTTADVQTDQSGSFRTFLPTERCTVSAVAKNQRGSNDVTITQGNVVSTIIILNQRIAEDTSVLPWIIILLICVFAVVFTIRKKAHRVSEVKHVLKEKERIIVDALIARKGKATLAELRSTTHIPRTSLLRTLESLESRNVLVKKEEYGKVIIELLGRFG